MRDFSNARARGETVHARRQDEQQYRLLLALCFVLFLVATVLMRLMPPRWRTGADGPGRRSVFAEARAAAGMAIPFAFRS